MNTYRTQPIATHVVGQALDKTISYVRIARNASKFPILKLKHKNAEQPCTNEFAPAVNGVCGRRRSGTFDRVKFVSRVHWLVRRPRRTDDDFVSRRRVHCQTASFYA